MLRTKHLTHLSTLKFITLTGVLTVGLSALANEGASFGPAENNFGYGSVEFVDGSKLNKPSEHQLFEMPSKPEKLPKAPKVIMPKQADQLVMLRQEIEAYSKSTAVGSTIEHALDSHLPKSAGRCYHYVKAAMYKGGLVPNGSLGGESAYMAVDELEELGFKNLLDSPQDLQALGLAPNADISSIEEALDEAPVGSILVFAGDSPQYRHGDVAIKTEEGYVNDYFSFNPITRQWNGSHFRLTGIMVKY